MKIIAEFGCNFPSLNKIIDGFELCRELNIKHAKFQLWTKDQAPKEVHDCYIEQERAKHLVDVGKSIYNIEVFFTCMYPEAVDICEQIGVKYHKVRFFDRNNLIIYRKLKKTEQPIFVSSNDPADTIYKNMATYQKRVNFLYCVPQYPAPIRPYLNYIKDTRFAGISDHTRNTELIQTAMDHAHIKWFEVHVCLDDSAHERKWSKTFEELKEVLK